MPSLLRPLPAAEDAVVALLDVERPGRERVHEMTAVEGERLGMPLVGEWAGSQAGCVEEIGEEGLHGGVLADISRGLAESTL